MKLGNYLSIGTIKTLLNNIVRPTLNRITVKRFIINLIVFFITNCL